MSYKTHIVLAGALAAILLTAGPAASAQLSGDQLLSLCTANIGGTGNPMKAAQCMGFVVGVADTFDCKEDDHGYRWNAAAARSQPELVHTVIQYIKSHPDALNTSGHIAIGQALSEAFPCPAKTAGN